MKHKFKDFLIGNIPYGSEPRWFVTPKNNTESQIFKYPFRTLKKAKNEIEIFLRKKQFKSLKPCKNAGFFFIW